MGELDRSIDLVIKAVVSEAEAAARLPLLRAERDRLQAELAGLEQPPKVVTLHPTAIADYLRMVERLAEVVNEGIQEGDGIAASALRDLIETVEVTAETGRRVTLKINGHLARLIGHDAFSSGGKMVAEEGLEPPFSLSL